jgi:hypothetical protein
LRWTLYIDPLIFVSYAIVKVGYLWYPGALSNRRPISSGRGARQTDSFVRMSEYRYVFLGS